MLFHAKQGCEKMLTTSPWLPGGKLCAVMSVELVYQLVNIGLK